VLLFVRSGETTPLFNHGRSSYSASVSTLTAASFQAGILRILQEPYLSRPFVDVEAVVAFRGQAKLHHSSTMAVRVTVPPTLSSTALRFR
jgi:hypothetical protein